MSSWHEEARQRRADGASLQQIADMYGVSRQRAHQVCRGVECSVDHVALHAANLADPEWRKAHNWRPGSRPAIKRFEGADYIRENYGKLSAAQIGRHLGITKNAVIGRARDLGLSKPKLSVPA